MLGIKEFEEEGIDGYMSSMLVKTLLERRLIATTATSVVSLPLSLLFPLSALLFLLPVAPHSRYLSLYLCIGGTLIKKFARHPMALIKPMSKGSSQSQICHTMSEREREGDGAERGERERGQLARDGERVEEIWQRHLAPK